MHPIERLRYMARAGDVDQTMLVREAASALGSLGDDPGHVLVSARRMLDRHRLAGAMWTLAARVLVANDPLDAAWGLLDELDDDETSRHLARALPPDAMVCVIGWTDLVGDELSRRGDIEVRVIDAYGEGAGLARRLDAVGVDVVEVPFTGLGAAVRTADIVVVEAAVAGPEALICPSGSYAALAVARAAGVATCGVVGAGRAIPAPMCEMAGAEVLGDEPWECDEEWVPTDLLDRVVGPSGTVSIEEFRDRADCPFAPELMRSPI